MKGRLHWFWHHLSYNLILFCQFFLHHTHWLLFWKSNHSFHWLLSKITSDNYDKVGGSFRSSDIEEFVFKQGSVNAVVILLLGYPNYNCLWWSTLKWICVCDVLWFLWWCLDEYYYPSIWLVNEGKGKWINL